LEFVGKAGEAPRVTKEKFGQADLATGDDWAIASGESQTSWRSRKLRLM
jgi:hypothetical protein